ncbi:MAG: hypothetical protein IT333_00850 [Thermomicrobiales bacterium]|nr:hypothetical protein [Thermomicrobiales bacterium]
MGRTVSLIAGVSVVVALAIGAIIAALLRVPSWRGLLTTAMRRTDRQHPRWELLAQ